MVSKTSEQAHSTQSRLENIATPKLKFKEKLSYGLGDLGNGMMFDMGQIYLLKFSKT